MTSFRPFQPRLALLLALAVFAGRASAADPAATAEIIYPHPAPVETAPAVPGRPGGGLGSPLLLFAVAAAGAGGWLLWRQRRAPAGLNGRDARKLAVTESRSLGNRQYLVVADYDGRKFLLGVCPGRIDLLAPIDPAKESTP